MSVIKTDQWLKEYIKSNPKNGVNSLILQRDLISSKLVHYFDQASASEIHYHLHEHGLFFPSHLDTEIVDSLCANQYWDIVTDEFEKLKKEWDGPDVPIFIFPSDHLNKQLQKESNGRSGLGYKDKVFLFVSQHTSKAEIKALITHEYHHVCRLNVLKKREDEMNLLESIILEGLAERAVLERLGDKYLAKWTSIYSHDFARSHWKMLKPHLSIPNSHSLHHHLLYGMGRIPKWLGYNIGYHLVTSFCKNNHKRVVEAMYLPAEKIVAQSDFPL